MTARLCIVDNLPSSITDKVMGWKTHIYRLDNPEDEGLVFINTTEAFYRVKDGKIKKIDPLTRNLPRPNKFRENVMKEWFSAQEEDRKPNLDKVRQNSYDYENDRYL